MKRYFSKNWLVLLIAPAFLLSFTALPEKAKFSGSWKLNEGKSELGDFGARFTPKKIKIDQKDDAITTAKTVAGFDGGEDAVRNETLTFDGKATETTMTGGFGTSKRKATLKWSADEKSFIVSYTLSFQGNDGPIEITGTEAWSLSNDGKTLTCQVNSTSPQGEFATKGVYDKE